VRKKRTSSGFALVLVLWTLVVLSAIALGVAATVGTELRSAQDGWNDLQAGRLATSGHEIAAYLETRGLGTSAQDFSGLPVDQVIQGYSYRVRLDIGTIDLLLEGENGKLDLASTSEDGAANFFTVWTGNPDRGRQIAASIADWIDSDDESRPLGAESSSYSQRGYLPRNAGLGAADLVLINGLGPDDFAPAVMESSEGVHVRNPLPGFITTALTGNRVNPNYAAPIVLQAVPGMTSQLLDAILQTRHDSILSSPEDLRNRTGLPADSPVFSYLTFDRGYTPAVYAVAHLKNSTRTRAERRTRNVVRPPGWQPGRPMRQLLWLVESHSPVPLLLGAR